MKRNSRLGRNYLLGVERDRINPTLSCSGVNLRKILGEIYALSYLLLNSLRKGVERTLVGCCVDRIGAVQLSATT